MLQVRVYKGTEWQSPNRGCRLAISASEIALWTSFEVSQGLGHGYEKMNCALVEQSQNLVDAETDILHIEGIDALVLLLEQVVDFEVHLEDRLLTPFATEGEGEMSVPLWQLSNCASVEDVLVQCDEEGARRW